MTPFVLLKNLDEHFLSVSMSENRAMSDPAERANGIKHPVRGPDLAWRRARVANGT